MPASAAAQRSQKQSLCGVRCLCQRVSSSSSSEPRAVSGTALCPAGNMSPPPAINLESDWPLSPYNRLSRAPRIHYRGANNRERQRKQSGEAPKGHHRGSLFFLGRMTVCNDAPITPFNVFKHKLDASLVLLINSSLSPEPTSESSESKFLLPLILIVSLISSLIRS